VLAEVMSFPRHLDGLLKRHKIKHGTAELALCHRGALGPFVKARERRWKRPLAGARSDEE
jgi:hypothetical protein